MNVFCLRCRKPVDVIDARDSFDTPFLTIFRFYCHGEAEEVSINMARSTIGTVDALRNSERYAFGTPNDYALLAALATPSEERKA